MELANLQKIDEFSWTVKPVTKTAKCAPIIFFGSKAIIQDMDEKVREQIMNVACLPGIVGAALTMPDAHWGYGFPIGGVAAFDAKAGGIISAGGVGFDISCGVRCLRTNLFQDEIMPHVEKLAEVLFGTVPAGVGQEGKIRLKIAELDEVMTRGARWAVKHGYGSTEDLTFIEENGCIDGADPEMVSVQAKKRQLGEMGTLGSGNHYLEVEVVEKIYDQQAAKIFGITEGQIIIAIHCGSRGLGHQIGTDYLILLAKAANRLGIQLPERELACAPILSEEGQNYIAAMHAAINCALANRQIITELTRRAFAAVIPQASLTTIYDVSHNTCKREKHLVNGKLRELYVHRKGATRAFGPGHHAIPVQYQSVGQPVFIGGSMGTGSYLLAGNKPEKNRAFASASHGAGRQMSRQKALKQWHGKELIAQLEKSGVYIRTVSLRGVAEEAPGAYKDVHEVAYATEMAGLARRVAFLKPIACVKG